MLFSSNVGVLWPFTTKMIYIYGMSIVLSVLMLGNNVQSTAKLNIPKVLLPVFKDISVNFTLSVKDEGCYEWTLSRHDLISIDPLYDSVSYICSRKAIVTVLSKEFSRKSVKILVSDSSQGITLNANVIIDEISTLKIVSNTRQVYLEEPPQRFEVRAYDAQGNEFSTLEGVEFQWTVHNMFSESFGPVMRVMTFAESPYLTPPTITALDNLGKHGHIALVEGTQTGLSKIEVQLPQSEYRTVPTAEIQVMVVENIELEPSVAYMMAGDILTFKLFQIRLGKRVEININDEKYNLVSHNPDIASITTNRRVLSKSVGKVEIVVHNIYITDKLGIQAIQLPTAVVIVANPHYMTLSILPYNYWTLVIDQKATIVPEVYSENNHKFNIGENVIINIDVPENIFKRVVDKGNNIMTGKTISVGSGIVSAQLRSPKLSSTNKRIYAENPLSVYPKLSIVPSLLILPWSSTFTPKLTNYSLRAKGGDNDYIWSSEDTSVAQISQSGVLKFNGPGSTTVSVYMRKNKYCMSSATLHLLIPEEISILNTAREVEIWNNINLHIQIFGRIQNNRETEKILFDSCDFLDFMVAADKFALNDDNQDIKPLPGACAVKNLKSIDIGCSRISVTLNTERGFLKVSPIFCSYPTLQRLQPYYEEHVVLAVGSSYDLVFAGGPIPMFGKIYEKLEVRNQVFSSKTILLQPQLYVYRITCVKLGSSVLQMTVSTNPIGFAHINAVVSVSVYCEVPKKVEVVGHFRTGCSEISPQRLVSYTASTAQFDLKIFDVKGRSFQNATSLGFKWKFEKDSIASFTNKDRIFLQEKDLLLYKIPLTHYIIVITHNESGDVTGYGWMKGQDSIMNTFLLSVVQEPIVEPTFLTLFNHPNHVGYLKIKGGSGYFSFDLSPSLALVKYAYQSRTVEIGPKNEGSSELIIGDKCLPETFPIRIDIQVVSVSTLDIDGPLKIQEGYYGKIIVKFYDRDFKPMPYPAMSLPKLGILFEISDLSVAEFDFNKARLDPSRGIIEINLKGKRKGQVTAWVQLGDITSKSLNIQIFPKIRVTPSNLTLVVGSEFQVTVTGGPSKESFIHFVANDPLITTVSSEAIVRGLKSGHTTITVMSKGYQGEVYCKDIIEVYVINLTGVTIMAPISKLGVGNTMPIWAVGIPHAISPLLLGSINPPLQFKWQVSVPNVVRIQDSLFKTNIQVSSESKLSVRLYGLNPGHTNVELIVFSRHGEKPLITFQCSLTIVVFNLLEWTRPNLNFKYMLMAPNSEYYLKTNALGNVDHRFSTFDSTSNPIIRVTSDGLLKSGANFGSAVVETKTMLSPSIPQTIFLTLQVQPVHYLMINVGTALETSEEVKTLPRGLYLNLTISYHDQYGTEFYVAPFTKPSYECNICSKIHVEYTGSNHSLITSLASAGNVILRVHDNLRHIEMEDFIKIPVDNYILPSKAFLTVGEVVCFWTPIVSHNAVWSTDNNVLQISKNGVAIAERSGFTSVIYSLSEPEPLILASISLEVLPLHSLLIGPSPEKIITNIVGTKYSIPVFLINEKSKKEPYYSKYCNSTGIELKRFPFQCILRYTTITKYYPVEKIFHLHEDFDFNTGSFICAITPIRGPGKESSIVNSNLTLTVTNQKSIYDTLFFNFHPQFAVSTDLLYLSRDYPANVITIYGSEAVLSSLFVEASKHKSISFFSKPQKVDTMKVIVKLETELLFSLEEGEPYLTISSPLTQQEFKVIIQINLRPEATPSPLENSIHILLSGLFCQKILPSIFVYSTLVLFFIVLVCFYKAEREYEMSYIQFVNKKKQRDKALTDSEKIRFATSPFSAEGRPLIASPSFVKSTAAQLRSFQSLHSSSNSGSPNSSLLDTSLSKNSPFHSNLQSRQSETISSSSGIDEEYRH